MACGAFTDALLEKDLLAADKGKGIPWITLLELQPAYTLLSGVFLTGTEPCSDKPVFTPPSLLVRYGHPASAVCSVCEKDCRGTLFGLESAVGTQKENGTNIFWEIGDLTEWDTSLICYYNHLDSGQCTTYLNITLYRK